MKVWSPIKLSLIYLSSHPLNYLPMISFIYLSISPLFHPPSNHWIIPFIISSICIFYFCISSVHIIHPLFNPPISFTNSFQLPIQHFSSLHLSIRPSISYLCQSNISSIWTYSHWSMHLSIRPFHQSPQGPFNHSTYGLSIHSIFYLSFYLSHPASIGENVNDIQTLGINNAFLSMFCI